MSQNESAKPIVTELDAVRDIMDRGAIFFVHESGGKDGQAMRHRVLEVVPREQIVIVHATLSRYEWPTALAHVRRGAERAGVPMLVAQARKTFAELVRYRRAKYPEAPSFPSAANRQCTADLKRDPCVTVERRYATERGVQTIVTCLGIRAEESSRRAKKRPLVRSPRYSTAGRDWYEWLPVHHLTEPEVFATIYNAGDTPHPAYAAGNKRFSCIVCFLACEGDVRNGALHNPEVFEELVLLEKETGYTMHQSRRPLEEVAGLTVTEAYAQRRHLPVLQESS